MSFDEETDSDFVRLHRIFTFHLGVAVSLSWMTSLYAAIYAPWVRNIRPLIDPTSGRPGREHLVLPVRDAGRPHAAWLWSCSAVTCCAAAHDDANQVVEFGIAGAVAFALFYLSIDRAVAAMVLGL